MLAFLLAGVFLALATYWFTRPKRVLAQETFPGLTAVDPSFDWTKAEPIKYRPFKNGEYKMTMAIRKMEPQETFLVELTYKERTDLRKRVIESKYANQVRACNPCAEEALREFYDSTMAFMTERYPMIFTLGEKGIFNTVRNESFPLTSKGMTTDEILSVCACNLEDDFLILQKDGPEGSDGEYYLRAGVSGNPAGFDPLKKFNTKLTDIHGPVPMYNDKLQKLMNKYFSRVEPGQFVVRNNWLVQSHCKLVALTENHAPEGADELPPLDHTKLDFNEVLLRVERQLLYRLPKTRSLVFIIRTYLTPMTVVRDEGLGEDLCGAIDGLPSGMKHYKRAAEWGPAVQAFMRGEPTMTGPTRWPDMVSANFD